MTADARTQLATVAAAAVCTVGMVLVVAGVLSSGLFLPGVVLIVIAAIGFAVASGLALLAQRPE